MDIRPTMLSLVGLKDDYQDDGRVLAEELHQWALPDAVRDSGDDFVELARAYKQINAPNGDLCRTNLKISTRALASGSPGSDSTYIRLENDLSGITTVRDFIAAQMADRLNDAAFGGKRVPPSQAKKLVFEADVLLGIVHQLAGNI